MADKDDKKNERQFLEKARKRYQYALDAWRENYEDMDEDIEFIHGENQWPPEIQSQRRIEGRPCLTFNKLPAIIDQAVGDQRRASPAIRVVPAQNNVNSQDVRVVNHAGTKDYTLAETYEGVIRNIQVQSKAEIAYDTAYEHASSWGLGWFRILTGYIDDESFDQEFMVKRIRNYKSVVADPDFEEPDGSDMKYAFIVSTMTEDEFEDKYPDIEESDWDLVERDQIVSWRNDKTVTIAEYYYLEDETYILYQTQDGQVFKNEVPQGAKVVNQRQVKGKKVCWAKITGAHILETTDTVFQWIPVIPVLGKELVVNGTPRYRGLIRHSKDAQRMYNFSRSADIERTALVPKVPYIIADQQIDGYEDEWENANVKNPSVLKYKLVPGAQKPGREPPVSTNPGEAQQSLQAADDIKSTTGIFDASQGQRSNETSGKAIVARATQGDTVLVAFADNLSRSMTHAGRILVDAIPKLYDTQRLLRIRFPDGQDDFVPINVQGPDGQLINDLSVGKFDVAVTTGPAYSTQRQEALDAMVQLIQANPNLWNIIGDLIAKNMDWPGAQEFEKRLRAQLPPEFLTEEERAQKPPPQPTPEQEATMAKAQAEIARAQGTHASAQADVAKAQAQAEAAIKTADAKAMQAEAMALQAIEQINAMQENVRNQVADALAEAILQMSNEFQPTNQPQPAPNQPQPGVS